MLDQLEAFIVKVAVHPDLQGEKDEADAISKKVSDMCVGCINQEIVQLEDDDNTMMDALDGIKTDFDSLSNKIVRLPF